MKCPNCGFEEAFGARECTKCGVIFAKWKAKKEKQAVLNAVPAATPAAASSSGLTGTLIKYAAMAAAAGLISLGGRTFLGWFGSWMKTAQANAPAARQAAMQSINIPKLDLSKMSRPAINMQDMNAMRQAQMQANINAAVLNAQRNAAINSAIRPYQTQSVPPGGYRR